MTAPKDIDDSGQGESTRHLDIFVKNFTEAHYEPEIWDTQDDQ